MVHPETPENLAIGEVWVRLNALLRSLIGLVEDIEDVEVPGSKFRAIYTVEEASCLVEGCHEGTTHVGSSILGLESFVLPAFDLNLRH